MKSIIYLLTLILFLLKPGLLYSQEIYIKTSTNYNFVASTQQMPRYFSYTSGPLYNNMFNPEVYLNVNEFSLASGLNFQSSVGYSLNDFISFEMMFSTFSNSQKQFEASPISDYPANGKTEWDFHSYSLLPKVLIGQSFHKSTVKVYVYCGYGISMLNITASYGQNFNEYKFERSYVFSWGHGLEYSYSITKNLSLFTNIGINNTNYKPVKAKIISSSHQLEYFPTEQKEIEYHNEIVNHIVGHLGSTNPHAPTVLLKETLKLNSVFLGGGIKYTLKK